MVNYACISYSVNYSQDCGATTRTIIETYFSYIDASEEDTI
jgi:hypothetical protein